MWQGCGDTFFNREVVNHHALLQCISDEEVECQKITGCGSAEKLIQQSE